MPIVDDRRGGPGRRYWTEERMIAALQAHARRTGKSPTWNSIKADPEMPNPQAIRRLFGNFASACVAAGFDAWPPGGEHHSSQIDERTRRAMERAQRGEKLAHIAKEFGITGQSLGRQIAHYRRVYGLPPLKLKPGAPRKAAA